MTHTSPLHTASWHAAQAEDLLHTARSASMAGWWQRGRRRDLVARAQVHATLAAALPENDHQQRQVADANMDALADLIADYAAQLDDVKATLVGYGLLADGDSPAEAVAKLMAAVYSTSLNPPGEHRRIPGSYYSYDPETGEPIALHVTIEGCDPLGRAATLNGLVRVVQDRATAGCLTPPIHVTVKDLPHVLHHPVDRAQFERLLESGTAAGVSGVAYGVTSWDEIANRWPQLSDRLLPGGPLRWEPASRQSGDPR